jgi:hypothetical protein
MVRACPGSERDSSSRHRLADVRLEFGHDAEDEAPPLDRGKEQAAAHLEPDLDRYVGYCGFRFS